MWRIDRWRGHAAGARDRGGVVLVPALAMVLAGCSGNADRDRALPSPATATPSPIPQVAASSRRDRGPLVNSSAHPHAIPSALVGKWGMGLADCDPSTGADKGVMTVAPDSLTFFESRAQLAAVAAAGSRHIRAAFNFVGEGMNWTREEELSLQSGGKSLIRREVGGEPQVALTRYIRCPQA